MLVEDNPTNVKIAQKVLSKLGLTIDVAYDGLQAVQKVQETDFELILMDLQMPIMGGLEATAQIKKLSAQKAAIPVVALTANAMGQSQQDCLDIGMVDFITKPLRLQSLVDALDVVFQQG